MSHIGYTFTIVANLRGIENFLRDCYRYPDNVFKLLDIVENTKKKCIDWVADYNFGICIADPVASSDLIGPAMYEKFVYPYTKELIDYEYQKTDKKIHLHMCGNSHKIWKYFKRYNLGTLSLDNCINFKDAVLEFGHDFILTGNIDPVGVVLNGSKEKIQQ